MTMSDLTIMLCMHLKWILRCLFVIPWNYVTVLVSCWHLLDQSKPQSISAWFPPNPFLIPSDSLYDHLLCWLNQPSYITDYPKHRSSEGKLFSSRCTSGQSLVVHPWSAGLWRTCQQRGQKNDRQPYHSFRWALFLNARCTFNSSTFLLLLANSLFPVH